MKKKCFFLNLFAIQQKKKKNEKGSMKKLINFNLNNILKFS